MNETAFSVSGTITGEGDSELAFLVHSIYTIMEPWGEGWHCLKRRPDAPLS
jgi:hypothetical protein